MARIFITGSTDGLGLLTAKALIELGHKVVIHARNEKRAREVLSKVHGTEKVLSADLSDINETKQLAAEANDSGKFDAVVHNAGVYRVSSDELFKVNTLAPYILTCLIDKPERLIYLSSGLHHDGHARLDNLTSGINRLSYSDTKLHDVILCKAVARKWPHVYSNSVDPGWVPTKMGGRFATGSLKSGYQTQVWLAVSNDEEAKVSGRYFYHMKVKRSNPEADDTSLQECFISLCREITGISFPD